MTGNDLKAQLEAAGINASQLADHAGYSRQFVARMAKRGRNRISEAVASRMRRGFAKLSEAAGKAAKAGVS